MASRLRCVEMLVYLRDNTPGLRFAGLWDLPGGAREGTETPEECIIRELHEECSFVLPEERIIWKKQWPTMHDDSIMSYFMVAWLKESDLAAMQFGSEGSKWRMMKITDYLGSPKAIEKIKDRLRDYLSASQ